MIQEITIITSNQKGPRSVVLVGVHGNETCGMKALESILPALVIEKGTVTFIQANPRAIVANKRFIEANLNRMFKDDYLLSDIEKTSYEYKRAQQLKKYLSQAEVLLDVHASMSKNSKSFIICEEVGFDIAQYLPADSMVSGFDVVQPGGTDYYMNKIGKIGICMECGYRNDQQSDTVAIQTIYAFLKTRGHISGVVTPKKQLHMRVYDIYITKTNKFVLTKPFADFEFIKKGNLMGIDGNIEVRAKKDSFVLFAENSDKLGSEVFLLGE